MGKIRGDCHIPSFHIMQLKYIHMGKIRGTYLQSTQKNAQNIS